MSHTVEAIGLGGVLVFWAGAWFHATLAAAIGIAIIVLAWAYGAIRS
jgi:hypothetical protein